MKKIFFVTCASLILLTGCSNDHELISAINKTYDYDQGRIVSEFEYTTQYNNIELEGTITGVITVDYGDEVDKVEATVKYKEAEEKSTYYVDSKGKVVKTVGQEDGMYAPLYIDTPDIASLVDSFPEPEATTINVDGTDVNVNLYTFEFDKMETSVARTIFDPIFNLGYVSLDMVQSKEINGNFKLEYYVDASQGLLVSEVLSFSNKENNDIATNTKVKIVNTYSYEEVNVEMPSEESEEASTESDGK